MVGVPVTRYRYTIERIEWGEFDDDGQPFEDEDALREHALAVSEYHGGDAVSIQVEEVKE